MCALCSQSPGVGIRSPAIVVTEHCEPPGGCQEPNLGPLQEQVLLTTELSLQPMIFTLRTAHKQESKIMSFFQT